MDSLSNESNVSEHWSSSDIDDADEYDSPPESFSLDLSSFWCIRTLRIGDNCFMKVKVLHIEGYHSLTSIVIGVQCFSLCTWKGTDIPFRNKDRIKKDKRACTIKDCDSLEEVVIGYRSFSDFVELHVLDLPKLETIDIGRHMNSNLVGSCFFWGSVLELSNVCSLLSFSLGGNGSFRALRKVELKDYAKLNSVSFDGFAICRDSRSLLFGNLPSLESISICGDDAFGNCRSLELSNLPSLGSIVIRKKAFFKVESFHLECFPSLESLSIIGDHAFYSAKLFQIRNLNSLVSIELDGDSLFESTPELTLDDLPSLSILSIHGKNAFRNVATFSLTNLDGLESVCISGSYVFQMCQSFSIAGLKSLNSLTLDGSCLFEHALSLELGDSPSLGSFKIRGFEAFGHCRLLHLHNLGALSRIELSGMGCIEGKGCEPPSLGQIILSDLPMALDCIFIFQEGARCPLHKFGHIRNGPNVNTGLVESLKKHMIFFGKYSKCVVESV